MPSEDAIDILIPSSVTVMRFIAFCNCDSPTSIVTPASVTVIDSSAFQHCSTLTSFIIENPDQAPKIKW